jgi:DNA-binding MarR family transcriptional regulator
MTATRRLSIETYVPYLVNRAAIAMLTYSAGEFERFGLTVPQWRILLALWEHRDCRFGDLAKLTSIEPPTLSRLLTAMTRERLVRRTPVPTDSRSVNLSLTAEGVELFESTIGFAREVNRMYIEGVSRSDLAALRRALTQIHANVERQRERRKS